MANFFNALLRLNCDNFCLAGKVIIPCLGFF